MKLSVVAPCFNEQDNIACFVDEVSKVVSRYSEYEIILVDDGSTDGTFNQIQSIASKDHHVKYISFSRNFGHQNALWAGLAHASGEVVVTMDSDLQHPPALIPELVRLHDEEKYDIVYTLREDSEKTGFFKKVTSRCFYAVHAFLSDACPSAPPPGAADFRLLDIKVVKALMAFKENSLCIRNLIAWCGFRAVGIPYRVQERHAGESKYTIKKMLNLAFAGITSFSVKPLRLSMILGSLIAIGSMIYVIYACVAHFILKTTIPGWTSLMVVTAFLDGIVLIMLGIIGEYLGRLFMENKRRPNYLIRESNFPEDM